VETEDVTNSDDKINFKGLKYYYGMENEQKCIISPDRCRNVTQKSYYNTCESCNIKNFVDNVFYGLENDKECVIDLNFCNLFFGNKDYQNNNEQCEFCFFNRFDSENQIYYGFENGRECKLNMPFCTFKTENVTVNECKWCSSFEVKFNNNNTINFITEENGTECYININKCGFYDMRNYNGTDGSSNKCTYCHIMEKKDNKYYGLENRMECLIQEEKCKEQINKYNDTPKPVQNASLRMIDITVNPIFTVILLIFVSSLMF